MSQPLDLNSFLVPALSSGNVKLLNQLIHCNLNSNGILRAVIETKNYAALKTLGDFIRYNECDRELVKRMYMEAIEGGNANQIEVHVRDYFIGMIDKEKISAECAKKSINLRRIPGNVFSKQAYCDALVELDNLDLLLEICGGLPPQNTKHRAGMFCSKKIMDHLGYSDNNLKAYISGAFQGKNKDTLIMLGEHAKMIKERFLSYLKGGQKFSSNDFFVECIRDQILELEETDWELLKTRNLTLYNMLRCDV